MSNYITTKLEALESLISFPQRLAEFKRNVFQKKKVFPVKVLTRPVFYTGDIDDPNKLVRTEKGIGSVAIFKGRILDDNMAHSNFLPPPTTDDDFFQDLLKSLHPNIVISVDQELKSIEIGDTILAMISPGTNDYLYDLQNMRMIQVKTKTTPPQEEGETELEATNRNLARAFNNQPPENITSMPPAPLEAGVMKPSNVLEDVHLIFWFAGQDGQNRFNSTYIDRKINDLGLNTDNNVFITSEYNNKNYAGLWNKATQQIEDSGKQVGRISLGLWSGGANAGPGMLNYLIGQVGSKDALYKVVLADPAPYPSLINAGNSFGANTTMYYNLEWWEQTYGVADYVGQAPDKTGNYFKFKMWEDLISSVSTSGGTVQLINSYNNSIVKNPTDGSLTINDISVTAHERILEDSLNFVVK